MNSLSRANVFRVFAAVAASCLFAPFAAVATTTESVRDDNFDTLQQGELEGVALTSDGFLYPAYAREAAGDTGAEIVWSVVDQGERGILCATGHEGKLVRLNKKGEAKVIADLADSELTAMAALKDGSVVVAGAPSGRLWQLNAKDELTTLTQLGAKFVWDMEVDEKGEIWAATGDEGKLIKITLKGQEAKAEVACDLHSRNLIDLWLDRDGKMGAKGLLYIAAQNPGWLYRFKPGEKEAQVIFNAETDEIRAIQPVREGLALAINTERAPTPAALQMTLRMTGGAIVSGPEAGGAGEGNTPQGQPQAGPPVLKPDPKMMGDVFTAGGKPGPLGPVSAVILLTPEGFSRPLWVSPERPIHSVSLTPDDHLLIAAGGNGRVFELQSRDAFALVADLKDDYVVRLTPAGGGWLLAAARNGTVSRMSAKKADKAIYRSRVFDVKTPVRWGRFYWSGDKDSGQKVKAAFRQGNTDDTEKGTWSEWTKDEEISKDEGVKMFTPPSRYMQYRLTFDPGDKAQPALRSDYIEAFYQQVNRAPRVKKILLSDGGPKLPSPSSSSGGGEGGSTGGEGSAQKSSGSSSPSVQGGEAQAGGRKPDSNAKNVNLAWIADDPNNDTLQYAVYYRASDETEWKLIDDKVKTTRLPLLVNGVGDGRYRFRVVATDKLDNPPGTGLEAELISDEIVIDNTPPRIEGFKVKPSGDRAEISFKAVDALSLISSISVDLDGDDAYPIYPEDGLYDQSEETVDWTTLQLKPGEHVATINVTDRRGNTSVQKAVFTIKK
ncbi:fibronectin type III domain-containing protein [Candidatus Sumerlaeota bacterium]|nr:fibronectin type III domain-containing protein [Candidatus Sumerlaeota bacterium]